MTVRCSQDPPLDNLHCYLHLHIGSLERVQFHEIHHPNWTSQSHDEWEKMNPENLQMKKRILYLLSVSQMKTEALLLGNQSTLLKLSKSTTSILLLFVLE